MWDNRPSDWEVRHLSDITTRITRKNDGNGHPLMTISAKRGFMLQSDKYSRDMAGQSAERYTLLRRGEFAYNKGNSQTAPQGCIFRLDADSAVVPFVYYCFSLNPQVDAGYATHAFQNGVLNRELARAINSGVRNDGLLNLPAEDFFRCQIAVPPADEQRAIAEVLSSVGEAIAKMEALIDAIQESRIALTHDFQGIDEQQKWPIRSIGSLVRQCQYGLSIPLDGEGVVPVLRMPDIDAGRVNVDVSRLKSTDVTPAEIVSCAINDGDILFNRTNSQALVGKTGIVRNPPKTQIVFASYLIRLVVKTGVNPFWLNAVLNLPRTQERLKTLATPGVSQWNINSKTLKRFSIPVPPKADQDRFANLYETVEGRLEAERAKLGMLRQTQTALAQELLSGRIRLPESIIARHRGKAGQAA